MSRQPAAAAEDITKPTPERSRHGPVVRLDRPIPDANGAIARPYRAIDTLLAMERRGSITAAMRQAGEDFRAAFRRSQLDALHASDLLKSPGGRGSGTGLGESVAAAREYVWTAMLAVGGLGSPGGSCLWHVVGIERTLKEWAFAQAWSGRRISQEAASGILIATLAILTAQRKS